MNGFQLKLRRAGGLVPVLAVAGCQAAPSVAFAGAYFPFWLVCLAIGVIGAAIARVVLIKLGVDDGMPLRLFTYTCLAAAIACGVALFAYGR